MMEIGGARQVFLLDDNGMPEPTTCVAQFHYAETAVTIVHAKNADTLKSHLGINTPRQCKTLHAIILNISEVPRD